MLVRMEIVPPAFSRRPPCASFSERALTEWQASGRACLLMCKRDRDSATHLGPEACHRPEYVCLVVQIDVDVRSRADAGSQKHKHCSAAWYEPPRRPRNLKFEASKQFQPCARTSQSKTCPRNELHKSYHLAQVRQAVSVY